MSRLEKKCLVASAGAHAFLFALLALAPLLWSSHRPQRITLPVLTFVPSILVDGAMGGGSPEAKAPPAPAPSAPAPAPVVVLPPAQVAPRPQTTPPKADPKPLRDQAETPAKPRPQKNGEPVPSNKKTADADEAIDAGEVKLSKRKPIQISLNRDSGSSREKAATDTRAQAQAAAQAFQAMYHSKVKGVLGAIGSSISTGTSIDVPGPGGAAFGDYGQFVVLVYKQAWTPPPELTDERATVRARVVILKNGTVESFKVVKNSGHAALDKSVARLESVHFIAKFPEGVSDERRTFYINFNLLL